LSATAKLNPTPFLFQYGYLAVHLAFDEEPRAREAGCPKESSSWFQMSLPGSGVRADGDLTFKAGRKVLRFRRSGLIGPKLTKTRLNSVKLDPMRYPGGRLDVQRRQFFYHWE
jgi:hypothetical protein